MANTGSIHNAQAPVGFSAVFMGDEFLGSLAPQCPIRLKSKISAADVTCFPGQAHLRGSRAGGRVVCGEEGGVSEADGMAGVLKVN